MCKERMEKPYYAEKSKLVQEIYYHEGGDLDVFQMADGAVDFEVPNCLYWKKMRDHIIFIN